MTQKKQTISKIVTIRFTEAEYAVLVHLAESENMTVSAYVRYIILGADVQPRKRYVPAVIADKDAYATLLAKLGASRRANNLNQIAKSVNQGENYLSPEREAQLQDACLEVREMRDLLMQTLGKRERDDK